MISDTERSILELLLIGHADASVARLHNISKRTLERHLAQLMERAGAPTRMALGAIAVHRRWVDLEHLSNR
jgi:DNA-binding CsgD family transcriptional regulator